ncbi:MAG: hypothetical protein ABR886_01095 [Dehalococcoidales bacterium]
MSRKAKARLLYSTISSSERVSELGAAGALIYTWLLTHCDDQGRYAGSAKKVKAEVVPLIDDIVSKDIETALVAMEENKLIIRYNDDKTQLIQIADWWEFQSGLRFTSASRYPTPEGWKDRIKLQPERDTMGKFRYVDTDTGEIKD